MNELIILLLTLAVVVFIFVAARALVLWYWRIDHICELLEYQNKILKAIFKQNGGIISDPDTKTKKVES
jgi:uncharacterized membrane protein